MDVVARKRTAVSVLGATLLAGAWIVASPSVDAAHALGGCNFDTPLWSQTALTGRVITCSSDSAIRARMGYFLSDNTTRVYYKTGPAVYAPGAKSTVFLPTGAYWESNLIQVVAR